MLLVDNDDDEQPGLEDGRAPGEGLSPKGKAMRSCP